MGSVRKRLERLEASAVPLRRGTAPYLSLYFKRTENFGRAKGGLEPLPLSPEEEKEAHNPEFERWWSDFLAAHDEQGRQRASPEEYRELKERWHEMRWKRHGIPRRAR